jgi:agmatine deiminase
MIADETTNYLYLADTLPKQHPIFYEAFSKLLKECKVEFYLLPNTKDIWAVDYMPVQIDKNKFVQFVYNPIYLRNSPKWKKTISDVDAICKAIDLSPTKSDILLDGGNLIKSKDKVIISERVFIENPNYSRKNLIKELENFLEVDKIYFIPEQPNDMTGHADGMVRFLNNETVIINDYKNETTAFKTAFRKALDDAGLETIKIPYCVDDNKYDIQANGIYINYLQMQNILIIPIFDRKEDEEVVRKFESLFNGNQIFTINCNEIADEGGILNCITWNIYVNENEAKNSKKIRRSIS